MDELAIFNSLEACFWIMMGLVVLWKSRQNASHARLGTHSAFWFILLGVSDIFEVRTGAWWRPWPLLAMKAMCLLALSICGLLYRRGVTSTRAET